MSALDLRFIGGTNCPVYFCWVIKGCNFACCGDHLSRGLIVKRPLTKSINAIRLFISVRYVSPGSTYPTHPPTQMVGFWHTSINLRLLHILPRHWVRLDDFWQSARLEILFTWLFLGTMLARVLLHALQVVCPPAELVLPLLKEVAGLLAHLDHPVWWVSEHFNNSRDLVVFRRSGE